MKKLIVILNIFLFEDSGIAIFLGAIASLILAIAAFWADSLILGIISSLAFVILSPLSVKKLIKDYRRGTEMLYSEKAKK